MPIGNRRRRHVIDGVFLARGDSNAPGVVTIDGRERKDSWVVAPMSARRRDAEADKVIANATDSSCRACGVERLTFEPPPMYCYSCVGRIKRESSILHDAEYSGGEMRKDTW